MPSLPVRGPGEGVAISAFWRSRTVPGDSRRGFGAPHLLPSQACQSAPLTLAHTGSHDSETTIYNSLVD